MNCKHSHQATTECHIVPIVGLKHWPLNSISYRNRFTFIATYRYPGQLEVLYFVWNTYDVPGINKVLSTDSKIISDSLY